MRLPVLSSSKRIRYVINAAHMLARHLLRRAGYDFVRYPYHWSLAGHLKFVLSRLNIDCVLDVGAHHGEFGLLLRQIGFKGKIISFEPVLQNYEALAKVCRLDNYWDCYRIALGNDSGMAHIHVMEGTTFSSLRAPSEFGKSRFGAQLVSHETQRVPMRRLDGILSEILFLEKGPRIFLKMDTQGHDLDVLNGARGCLQYIVALQSEVTFKPIYHNMPLYKDFIDAAVALGFEVTGLFPVSREHRLAVIELDCVMVKSFQNG